MERDFIDRIGIGPRKLVGTAVLAEAMRAAGHPIRRSVAGRIVYHPEEIARWQRQETRKAGRLSYQQPSSFYCKSCR